MPALIPAPTSIEGNGTTTSSEVAAANGNREYLLVQNDSDTVQYLGIGVAAEENKGIRLNASGGSYEMSRAYGNLSTAAVNIINGTGSKAYCGAEASAPAV